MEEAGWVEKEKLDCCPEDACCEECSDEEEYKEVDPEVSPTEDTNALEDPAEPIE